MIKRELAKDEKLKNESWDRFLPKFKKKNVKNQKPAKISKKDKKSTNVFPPSQTPRKVDLLIESGEFFLSKTEKKQKTLNEKIERQAAVTSQRQAERKRDFVAPAEDELFTKVETDENDKDDIKNIVQKLGGKKIKMDSKKNKKNSSDSSVKASKKRKLEDNQGE